MQPAELTATNNAITDEEDLIAASRRGDLHSLNQLVLRYQGIVYNLAYRMLNDPDSAADVAQDVFISAYRAVSGFRGGSFKAWVLRIASNACYDYLRRKQRRPAASLESMFDCDESPQEFPDGEPGPEEIALRRELMEHIQEGLLCLPMEQRLVVVLSDVHGLSYEEIAKVANCSLGTVRSRLSRGRARLRDYLVSKRELLPSRYRLDV